MGCLARSKWIWFAIKPVVGRLTYENFCDMRHCCRVLMINDSMCIKTDVKQTVINVICTDAVLDMRGEERQK